MCETQFEDILPEEPEVVDIAPQEPEIVTEEPPAPEAPRPKKRGWIPYVILAAIFVVGLGVYLLTSGLFRETSYVDPKMPWFSIRNGTLSFHPQSYPGGSTLIVPETIAGQTVTALSEGCFSDADTVIMIKLPGTLRIIGDQAFSGCDKLRGVFIPSSVVAIGTKAFLSCPNLESLCIPGSVTAIGKGAFGLCPKLEHIFYTGSLETWSRLYREPITQQTFIYAPDGMILQADIAS